MILFGEILHSESFWTKTTAGTYGVLRRSSPRDNLCRIFASLSRRPSRNQTHQILMLSLFHSTHLDGLTALLAIAILLGACQSDTTEGDQQDKMMLPEGKLAVEDPWVRPASRGDSTTLYMTVANGKSTADTLLGAQQAPAYDSVQIFAVPDTAEGMAQAQPVDSLVVPAKTRVTLVPDSAYLMLDGLGQSLKEGGESFLVTVEFAQSGLQQVQASVRTSPPSEEQ